MNSNHIHDLTVRLAQALDQNYDVIHMDDVISVISTLEGTTITKEQLETTRLAKYINHLRRRTKSEHLARRAKSLLKKWREMVGIQQQQQNNESTNVLLSALPPTINYNLNMNQEQRLRAQSISPAGISTNFDAIHLHHSNSNSSQNVGVTGVNYTATDAISRPVPHQNMSSIGLESSTSKCTKCANHENICKRVELPEGQYEIESALSTSSTKVCTNNKKQPISFQNLLSGLCDTDRRVHGVDVPSCKSTKSMQRKSVYTADQSSNSNSEMSCNLLNRPVNIAPIVIDIQDSNSGSNLTISAINNVVTVPSSKLVVAKNTGDATCNSSTSLFSKHKRTKKDKKRKDRDMSVRNNNTACMLNPKIVIDETSNQQRNLNLSENEEKSLFINDDKSRLTFPMTNISEILSLSNSSMGFVFPSEGVVHSTVEQNIKSLSSHNNGSSLLKAPVYDLTFSGKFKQSGSLVPASSDCGGYNATNLNKHTASPNLPPSNNFSLPTGASATKFVPFRDNGNFSNDSNSNSRTSHFDLAEVVHTKALQDFGAQKKRDTLHTLQKPIIGENALIPPIISSVTSLPQKFLQAGEDEIEPVQTTNSIPEKIPRKRGRKKGSKGIDSVIAKETSLTSHMLMTSLCSGGKKVKTTKELYTEMQNRKLGGATTSSSPTLTNWHSQQQVVSRPASSCSDDGDSDSDTATSEPSRDSAATQKHVKRSISIDSNSNSQLMSIKMNEYHNSVLAQTSTVINAAENQLFDFIKELPPVPSINNIEFKCTAELVPCTCKINEKIPEQNNTVELKSDDVLEDHYKIVNTSTSLEKLSNKHRKSVVIEMQSSHEHGSGLVPTVRTTNSKFESDVTPKVESVVTKPKKSIFDLDFDDDDDPLHTIKAEAAAANVIQDLSIPTTNNSAVVMKDAIPTFTPVEITDSSAKDELHPEMILEEVTSQVLTSDVKPDLVLPIYEVVEDPHCVAKKRYEIQTQKITKFHIKSLHNYFIPNVNGNWDNSNNVRISAIKNTPSTCEAACVDGYDVVPKYGSLIIENIRKDLSHITFSKTTFPQKTHFSNFKCIPFLGMARTFERLRNKNKRHLHKKCQKLINKGNSVTDDPYLQCEANLFVTTNSSNQYNNSPFKNITIDISEPCVDVFVPQVSVVTDTAEQNLLAIVDNLNYNPTKSLLDDTGEDVDQAKMNSIKDKTDSDHTNKLERRNSITPCVENIDKIKGPESIDRNISSRRSSSCSNSSLKQTQQSINLKLKRKFQEQKELRTKRRLKKCNRHKFQTDDDDDKKCSVKMPRIKRIKIAINGDVATQMQISCGSSNNSSDEFNAENRGEESTTDFDTINDDCDEVRYRADGYGEAEENEEMESENSGGRQNSTCKTECNMDYDNSIDADVEAEIEADNNENDEHEIDFENYVDADVDFDEDYEDGEEYVSAYHEVVTRDIATPSTGNNHIVLTIKKTPSKTNSPSDSLSGMSPVITNKNSNAANVRNLTSPLIPINTQNAINTADIDMNAVIVKKLEIEEPDLQVIDISENLNINEIINSEPAVEILLDSDTDTKRNSVDLTSPQAIPFVQLDNVFCSLSPSEFLSRAATYQLKHRFCRRRRKPKESPNFTANNTTTTVAKKLHQQLFFPHELYFRDYNGVNQAILNIASCSSSCLEESDDEYYSTFVSEQYEEQDFKVSEQIQDGGSEQINNIVDITSNKFEDTTFQCKPRSPFTSSICSTCSEDSGPSLNTNAIRDVPLNISTLPKDGDELSDPIRNEINSEIKQPFNNYDNDDALIIKEDNSMIKTENSVDNINVDNELSNENNGLLQSFNNIYCTTNQSTSLVDADYDIDGHAIYLHKNTLDTGAVKIKQKQQTQQLPNKNCDDYNNIYNMSTNNINLIKYVNNVSRLENHISCRQNDNSSNRDQQQQQERSYKQNDMNANYDNDLNVNDDASNLLSSNVERIGNANCAKYNNEKTLIKLMTTQSQESVLLPHTEYRTGLRAVDEDVDDEDGNNCARIQQFKEWHQVLQLRSYNDELLTVLPYVVLE